MIVSAKEIISKLMFLERKVQILFLELLSNIIFIDSHQYLCPINASSWALIDQYSREIYRWIYTNESQHFKVQTSIENRTAVVRSKDVFCLDEKENFHRATKITRNDFHIEWICLKQINIGRIIVQSEYFNSIFDPRHVYIYIENESIGPFKSKDFGTSKKSFDVDLNVIHSSRLILLFIQWIFSSLMIETDWFQ